MYCQPQFSYTTRHRTQIYHTSNSCECMGVNGEALQLHAVYKKSYFLLQVTRESVSVLQVTWESVSGTASHARCIWTCNEIEGSYDKIIITIAPSYTGKNITHLLPLALLLVLHTRNNTDGNKLMTFFVCMIIIIVPSYTGRISLVCCRWHCYSCCTLVTIQTATSSWHFSFVWLSS